MLLFQSTSRQIAMNMEIVNQDEDLAHESESNPESRQSTNSNVQLEQLKSIADSGTVETDWTELQATLKSRLVEVVDNYIERNGKRFIACCEEPFLQPNVEEFNLSAAHKEIIELIESFNEPPFTIQRVCELLHSPFDYYDRISTFLRGLEKNLRVISSNNWPKPIHLSDQIKTSDSPFKENDIDTDAHDNKGPADTNDVTIDEQPRQEQQPPQPPNVGPGPIEEAESVVAPVQEHAYGAKESPNTNDNLISN